MNLVEYCEHFVRQITTTNGNRASLIYIYRHPNDCASFFAETCWHNIVAVILIKLRLIVPDLLHHWRILFILTKIHSFDNAFNHRDANKSKPILKLKQSIRVFATNFNRIFCCTSDLVCRHNPILRQGHLQIKRVYWLLRGHICYSFKPFIFERSKHQIEARIALQCDNRNSPAIAPSLCEMEIHFS